MHASSRPARHLFSGLFFLAGIIAAHAQNTTYTGTSSGFSLWGIGPWSNGTPTSTGNATVTPNINGDAGLIFPFGGITLHGLTIGDSAAPYFVFTLSSQGGSDALTFSGANAYLTQPANSGSVYLDTKISLTSTGLIASIDSTTTTGLAISGTGSIDKFGTGTLRIGVNSSNASDATGVSLNLNAGTVSLGASGANGSMTGKISMNDPSAILQLYRTDAFTHTNQISGSGTIAQIGTGTATLSGYLGLFNGTFDVGTSAPLILTNTVGSFTKQGAGTLILAADLGPNNITVTSGTLQIGNGGTTGNLASNTNISLPIGTSLVLNRTDDFTFSASTTGNGTISKLGTNTVTLHLPDNGFGIGLLSIAGGHLVLDNSTWHLKGTSGAGTLDVLGTTQLLGAATHTGGTTVSGSGTTLRIESGGSLAGDLVLNTGTSLYLERPDTGQLLPGNISGAGSIVMNSGSSSVFLTGNVAPTGGVDIQSGTLQVGNATTTGTLTGSVTVDDPATLIFNRSNAATMALAVSGYSNSNLIQNGAGDITLTSAQTFAGTITVNGAGQLIFNSTFTPSDGSFDKRGSGTLVLNGATTAGASVYGGTVQIGSGAGASYSGSVNLGVGTTLQFNPGANLTFGGNIGQIPGGGSGGVLKTGSFNVTLTSSSLAYTGSTVISGGSLIFNPTADLTLNSPLSGTGSLVKAGANTLTLSNSTAPAGGTTISGGRLTIANATFTGAVAVSAGATLALMPSSGAPTYGISPTGAGSLVIGNSGTNLTLSGDLSGLTGGISFAGNTTLSTSAGYTLANQLTGTGGNITKTGAGTIILTGNSTIVTPFTINTGTVQLGTGGTSGSVASAFNLNGTSTKLILNHSNNQTLANSLSGNGIFVQQGAGNVSLTDSQSFTGTFQVDGGALTVGTTTSFTKTGTGTLIATGALINQVTLSAGTLQIGNAGTSGASNANIVTSSGTTLVFNRSDTLSTDFTAITGGGQVIQAGAGVLALTSNNSFTGGLLLNSGTVSASTDARLGGPASALTFNGGILQFTGGFTLSSSRPVTLNSGGGTFNVNTSFTDTINQAITGTGSLTKTGAGILTLGGANTYGGSTTISAGTLRLGANAAIPAASAVSINPSATLDLANRTVALSALTGSGSILLGTGSLTFGTGDTSVTYAGNISNTGSLSKIGTGTLTLSGSSSYSGGTTLTTGTIALGSATALGTGTLTVNGGALVMASNADLNVANPISLASNLTFGARAPGVDGLLTLSGPITLTGDRTITSLDYPLLAGTISGAHALTASGPLLISGNNTFTGGLIVNAGSFILLGHDNAAGTGTITMTDATLQPLSSSRTLANTFSLAGNNSLTSSVYDENFVETGVTMTLNGLISGSGALSLNGIGTFVLPRANTFSGSIDFSQGTLRLGHDQALGTGTFNWSGGTLDLTAARTLANPIALASTVSFGGSVDLTLNGVVSGSALFTKDGTSTLTLTNTNTYQGTTLLNSGNLALGSDQALGTSQVTISGGALSASGGARAIANSLTFSGDAQFTGSNALEFANTVQLDGTRILTVDTPVTFDHGAAPIAPGSSLTKAGNSILTLAGTSTYTGATTVNGGILSLGATDTLSSASALFLGGGTLRTTGFNQALGTLGLLATSTLDFAHLSSAVTFGDSHTLSWSGTLTITNYDTSTNSLRFGSDSLGLTSTQLSSLRFADYGNSLGQIDSNGFVTPSAIPEPSTYAAVAGLLALTATMLRRKGTKSRRVPGTV